MIRRGGEVLLTLLNDMLDLARIETGRLELEDGAIDVADLVRSAEAVFAPQAADRGLRLRTSIDPAAQGAWRGDAVRLRQILFNLVANALKFTAQGEVSITLAATAEGLALTVSDTGPGIAPERQASLFDRFVQGSPATPGRFGGSGLGLAICRELAELMGGTIAVRSAPGEGAAFTVTLPFERAPAGMAPAPSLAQPAPREAGAPSLFGRPVRVLAAEDNPMNRLVLQTLLEQAGVEVAFAANGAEAVDAWRDGGPGGEPWDVILMDVQMPVMDGRAAARAIRAAETAEGRPRMPIVALTANAMAHQHDEYLAAGMDAVVAKPLRVADLLAAIGKVVAQGPASSDASRKLRGGGERR